MLFVACPKTTGSDDDGSRIPADITLDYVTLEYADVSKANPLKGFATWEEASRNGVPCSLEYVPIKFNQVLVAENTCDYSVVEKKLENARKRGHQVILRFIIDEPKSDSPNEGLYLPDFLSDVARFQYWTDKSKSTPYGYSPDYNDEELLGQILFFIGEFAKKYDVADVNEYF